MFSSPGRGSKKAGAREGRPLAGLFLEDAHDADVGVGDIDAARGGVGKGDVAGGAAGDGDDGGGAERLELAGGADGGRRLGAGDDRSAGQQRHRDGDVGAGGDIDVGVILHQVDAGAGQGEGGCTGGVLDAVAAGEPVGGEQDRVVGGDGLLGLVDGA